MSNQIVFISHGGGPMPLLGDPQHAELVSLLKALPDRLRRPKLIVVISAHWESDAIAITSSATPALLFDYYGFPEESYRFSYPAPGAPQDAQEIANTLEQEGFKVVLDSQRGLDHGVFIPLMLMYPDAEIPVLQVSLAASLDAAQHIALGEALAKAALPETLFIGSGFSFHNMRAFFANTPEIRQANEQFEAWLQDTLLTGGHDIAAMKQRMTEWHTAPGAHFCHPREEHLLPLHVCLGLAGRAADRNDKIEILHKVASNFMWFG